MATSTREISTEPLSTFIDRLGATLVQRPFYHGLGWLGLLAVLVVLQVQEGDFGFGMSVASELITVIAYAVVVYINLLYLFPTYLRPGRYWTYLLALIVISALFTPLELMMKYMLYSGYPDIQAELSSKVNAYIFGTFLVTGMSSVGKIMVDWIVQNRKKQQAENESMQSELRFLKSQINPHFLFNTLNSLYALTLKKSDKAPDIVIKLSEMMRYMLYECNEPKVPLRKEINYLKNYLDLERLRQREGIEISLDVRGNVVDQQVAPLMLIPFLENSFKHGINSNIEGGFVRAELTIQEKSLKFTLENTKGSNMPTLPTAGRPSGGIGLVNVRRRLKLIYPKRHQLDIHETPGTYQVSLNLQL